MDPRTFERLAGIARRAAGIRLRPGSEVMLTARLASRLRELGLPDEERYAAALEADWSGAELREFIERVTTNFTSFFREPEHFVLLRDRLAELVAESRREVRIWSAATSSGEEAWSLAITAAELARAEPRAAGRIRILGTDLSSRQLRAARRGVYPAAALDHIPPGLRRYFRPLPSASTEPPSWSVVPELRSMVAFRRVNLARSPLRVPAGLDVVLCRNVLIYLDEPVRAELARGCAELLRPGGLLLVGHADPSTELDGPLTRVGPSVFRRPGGEPSRALSPRGRDSRSRS